MDADVTYTEELRKKGLLNCQLLLNKGDRATLLKLKADIIEYQIAMLKPRNFDSQDTENTIKLIEMSFENICTSLEEAGVHNPAELSTFSFYSKIAYFEKKNKPK